MFIYFFRRSIDGHLLLEMVSCTGCQAAHARFPDSLERLCNLKTLKGFSAVTALDLTGASITLRGTFHIPFDLSKVRLID